MKKILFCLILLATFSCQNEDMSTKKNSDAELKLELSNFNSDFQYQTINNMSILGKKHWWDVVGQVCAIAGADAAGAGACVQGVQAVAGVIGAATEGTGYVIVSGGAAVVGAVGGSYAAYYGFHHKMGNFNSENPIGESVVYDLPKEFSYINNYGVLHNKGLEEIYFTGDTYSSDKEYNWIMNNIPNASTIDMQKVYNSPELKKSLGQVKDISSNYALNNGDYKSLLNDYKSNKLMSQTTYDILNSFLEAQSKSLTFDDTKKITDFYINAINNSDIEKLDKQSIYSALAVYIQSYYYWTNFEIKE